MSGNRRFVNNDFPPVNRVTEKRELVVEGQAPIAAILGCADSRVIPELIFVQGIGQLFVTRVAGNYPDDLVIGSIEYAIEHLGTKLVMVLGHEGCGAVKAVYSALEKNETLPKHLSTIQDLLAPGIADSVKSGADINAAIAANARAGAARLRSVPPVLSTQVASGRVRVAAGVYHLRSGEVTLVE
jgi:carbonic anhydrase